MYFEIDNTPEHIKRARKTEAIKKITIEEETPRLTLAPFSRPPQVVFENVLIGTSSERNLEVYNPNKYSQQITLERALPPGLHVELPAGGLILEPETCYCLCLMWIPMQPIAVRETIHFINEDRGRYNVVVVLKSVMNCKGKGKKSKPRISPGKIKKKIGKKSPVAIYKKKAEIIYNTTKIKTTTTTVQHKSVLKNSNKENISNDFYIESHPPKCPFGSPSSIEFNTSEIFSNVIKPNGKDIFQATYDKSYDTPTTDKLNAPIPQNVLKPRNSTSASDIFDNFTFTPLKSVSTKSDKLDKGPNIIISLNSDSDSDGSLQVQHRNKDDEPFSIICVTSSQASNKWAYMNSQYKTQKENEIYETIQTKKIPDTSSPKEMNTPNFSINTDFSRISDLSFLPQRFSTEKKVVPRMNETHELIGDVNFKLNSDTYTKESPNTVIQYNDIESKPYALVRHEPLKACRQTLFRENQQETYDRNYMRVHHYEHPRYNDVRSEVRSPPRSLTPPLQSIPEESSQFADTQRFDNTKTITNTFTINRTFDKPERPSLSTSGLQSWSKKTTRAEPELWKMPTSKPRKSLKPKPVAKINDSLNCKVSNVTFECNKSITVNQVGNVYSQSFTVDPFSSSTYFYDEQAVDDFEREYKRWLNYILTPPADLDSNVEQKMDIGKTWIENKNRDVPLAPTKEKVCSVYHDSHRLESLRRAARALLKSPEIEQVIQKLNAQIEKKLIAVRTDRNLHLDVGLQKNIMELLLSYNPLWLRIGLEAIYGQILPLKSNNDIDGLTSFIIQRMFKNPLLKNKHSKSSAPNMLLPAYMEAIKKFTLKKFFTLVFFLDQAKQKKLIQHDPCLFCRNAVCKESREIIIRFTRDLIAGIGDITKHLRPLGYVISHKQCYLDEFKYAVHNIALDIRDGVRLTKVMEIILMRSGLLNQLRTPAISRLQRVHNVQVALNALKEANFVIVGDITASDIADGHREKTLSLLWQIIHVFRAPLFEKAANVIQVWWKKKYKVIMEKKRIEMEIYQRQNNAASVIQFWWWRIQYNRLLKRKMQQRTTATIVLQKYCRMWLCRNRLRKIKTSVLKIELWFRDLKMMREAKQTLEKLRLEKEKLRRHSATIIQSYVRRWMCMKQYRLTVKKLILLQSVVRCFLLKKRYLQYRESVIHVQQRYRSKLLMKTEMLKLSKMRKSAILIQSYYRMRMQYKTFQTMRNSVRIIEERFTATLEMRNQRKKYLELKKGVIKLQALFRCKITRKEYLRQKNLIINLQRTIKAHQAMKRDRATFLRYKAAANVLQNYTRSYLKMKKDNHNYLTQRTSAILIQRYFRSYLLAKSERKQYIQKRNATIVLQKYYKALIAMRQERSEFIKLKLAALAVQRQYRANLLMKKYTKKYEELRLATIKLQRRFRAQRQMYEQRSKYLTLKASTVIIQNTYRAYVLKKQQRQYFLQMKNATLKIQNWFRSHKKGKEVKQQYEETKQACVYIQRIYRAYIMGRRCRYKYLRIRTATVRIQNYYRSYIEMKSMREQYVQLKAATVTIQKYYRSHLKTKKQRQIYLETKSAALLIQNYYRGYKKTKMMRQIYCELKKITIYVQKKFRSICAMRCEREKYLKLRNAVVIVQRKYRALIMMRKEKQTYQNILAAVFRIQTKYRAQRLMLEERTRFVTLLKSCISIQRFYRGHILIKEQRSKYLRLKQAAVTLQRRYRALLVMRRERYSYIAIRSAAISIQRRFRAYRDMLEQRIKYVRILKACVTIQTVYRSYLIGKKQKTAYIQYKSATILIQRRFRSLMETRKTRSQYLQLRYSVILIQRQFRANKIAREIRCNNAAQKIQTWYRSVQKRNKCRNEFLKLRKCSITIQSIFRMYIVLKWYVRNRKAAATIQRFYRAYKLGTNERLKYLRTRTCIIKLQAHVRAYIERKRFMKIRAAIVVIQSAYRMKKIRELLKKRRHDAAICIQKNIRRYIAQSRYTKYRKQVLLVQRIWREKLVTTVIRSEFLQKKRYLIKLQAIIRGYLVRKRVQLQKENILKIKEENRRQWAALKIQALFRGNKVRVQNYDKRVELLRRKWREGALMSTQETLRVRNEEAIDVLYNMCDIESVIRSLRSLYLLTEVMPTMYTDNANFIARQVYLCMSLTNRSISSIEVLKYGALVLLNLARYSVTGPKIYMSEHIPLILKFMCRFIYSEIQLFCILATYLWLFSKYDEEKRDLMKFLHLPENHKILKTIKSNVDRKKRMANNATRSKFNKPPQSNLKDISLNQSGFSSCANIVLPALEPDYGIVRAGRPHYFEDPQQAINCLFQTYGL